ncbi:MAG: hypothetical protein A4E72_01540 [Syntrophus sp. PtaU1.Bin208]|nr:MAG: hypothetical protein A4E72_01540 [Syntrophus sp. PtaU1.Bin208]
MGTSARHPEFYFAALKKIFSPQLKIPMNNFAKPEVLPIVKTRKRAILQFLLLLLSFSSITAFALNVPDHPTGRVTDLTGTLSSQEIASLDHKLDTFERATTNQIAVLLIPSLEGDPLEDYSIRLAEKWKIGQKGRNNGVILLVVKNDRKIRIEVGYGLEGALPDGLAGAITRDEIAPRFRNGQFYQGVDAGTNAIMSAIRGEYKPAKQKTAYSISVNWNWPGILIFVVFLILNLMDWIRRRRQYHSGGSGGWSSGGGFFGGGGFWGSSDGGFSGGGGDFGGGGSSGDW